MGGYIMPRVQLAAVTPKHRAWNKGRIIGQNRPLLPKQVWAIRARLELAYNLRDLSLFNVAIDSKLRGCDLVKLEVSDLVKDGRVRERVSVIQSKTKRPVQFELTENTRETVLAWVKSPEMFACRFMVPSRFHGRPHISTWQYGRIVRDWGLPLAWHQVGTARTRCDGQKPRRFVERPAISAPFSCCSGTPTSTALCVI